MTRANVLAIGVLRDELQAESIARGRHSVCGRVVGALEGALGGAVRRGTASASPLVTIVAVGAGGIVEPSPVMVDDDLTVDVGAAGGGALLPGQLRVGFGLQSACLLGRHGADGSKKNGK